MLWFNSIGAPFLQVPGGDKVADITVGTVTDGVERFCGRVWTDNPTGGGTLAIRSICSKFHLLPLKMEVEIQIWNGF